MPRPLRQIQANTIYHVLNRSNDRALIFHKPKDFQAFLEILAKALERFEVDLLAWCLMGNHWHLVLRPRKEGQLQAFMQWISITHVRRHHAHRGRSSGHLYQGRYKHFVVEVDEYFLTLCRYVEANALRARLVKRAQDWPWTSLHQRIKRQVTPSLSDWPVDRPADWIRLVNQALPEDQLKRIQECLIRGRPLGSESWVKRIAKRLGLEQTLRDRGRPAKAISQLSPRQRRRREAAAEKPKRGQKGA